MTTVRNFLIGSVAALAALAAVAPAIAQEEPATAPAGAPTDPAAAPVDPNAVPVDPNAPVDPMAVPPEEEVAPIEEIEAAVENPYGLRALWTQGDYVTKSVLIILILMSVGSWYIFITKFMVQGRLRGQASQVGKRFWSAKSLGEGIDQLSGNSVFRKVAEDGLRAADHHQRTLRDKVALHEWVSSALRRSIDDVSSGLQGGIAFLATVGSISPFVGLFGTVWGILKALISIGVAGQASIDKVAGPVGEALIMTAIGLVVAVPAVASYNLLVRRNKKIIGALRHFADDLEVFIVSGSRMSEGKRKG
jgi:biopolymer transport protein ExbB